MAEWVDAVDDISRRLGTSLPFVMLEAVQVTVTAAKSGHPWRNRTGRTEATTRSDGVRGSLRGGYRITIASGTNYSSYLEDGREYERQSWHRDSSGNEVHMGAEMSVSQWAYLLPAWERTGEEVARYIEDHAAVFIQ